VTIFTVSYGLLLLPLHSILCLKYIAVYRLLPDDDGSPSQRVGRIKTLLLYEYCVCTCFRWYIKKSFTYT